MLLHRASERPCRKAWLAACVLAGFFSVASTGAAAQDIDALNLKAEPEQVSEDTGKAPMRWLFEAAGGRVSQRYGLPSETLTRLSADLFFSRSLGEGWRITLSDRLDHVNPDPLVADATLNTVREAYVSWQDAPGANYADFGRINLRFGPGFGYNPTDFFRDGSQRNITTPDPVALREVRQGTVVLRGQRLWQGGSLAAMFSPKLSDRASGESFSLDLGSTNNRDRALVVLGHELREGISGQLLLHKAEGDPAQVGANITALAGQSVVLHGEWMAGRERTLAARAWGTGETRRAQRGVAGATWTSASKLSVTAELQYNGFALDRDGWKQAFAAGSDRVTAYLLEAERRQDLAARRAVLVYLRQKDLGMRGLDLTGFVRRNQDDRSRMSWIELRQHWSQFELAVQFQQQDGRPETEFGFVPYRRSWQIVASYRL